MWLGRGRFGRVGVTGIGVEEEELLISTSMGSASSAAISLMSSQTGKLRALYEKRTFWGGGRGLGRCCWYGEGKGSERARADRVLKLLVRTGIALVLDLAGESENGSMAD